MLVKYKDRIINLNNVAEVAKEPGDLAYPFIIRFITDGDAYFNIGFKDPEDRDKAFDSILRHWMQSESCLD